MDKGIFANKLGLGSLNGLTKRVAPAPAAATERKSQTPAFARDAFNKTSPATTGASSAAGAAKLRLAKAYHPDPAVFARNMAKAHLEEMVQQLG